jgi:hypothetical protein
VRTPRRSSARATAVPVMLAVVVAAALENDVQQGIDAPRYLEILHNDIHVPFAKAAAERPPNYVEIVEQILAGPALSHVYFDISWDEAANYAVRAPETVAGVARMLNRFPDRLAFGTDMVAPAGPQPYVAFYEMWNPVWRALMPEASAKVRKGNYERAVRRGTSSRAGLGTDEQINAEDKSKKEKEAS